MGASDFSGVNRDIVTPGADVHTPTHWVREESFWRDNWHKRPYVRADCGYEHYAPAYRYGVESAHRLSGRDWDEVEDELSEGWERYEHRSRGTWEEIKAAVRDAWDRVTEGRRDPR